MLLLTVVGAAIGAGIGLVPAVAAVVPGAPLIVGGASALLGLIAALASGGRQPAFEGADDEPSKGLRSGAASARSSSGASGEPAGEPRSRFFDDFATPVTSQPESSYTPTFDSVMFALGDVENTRGNRIDLSAPAPAPAAGRAPSARPTPDAAAERPGGSARAGEPTASASLDTSRLQQGRPLENVAAMSPFGVGTEHLREAGSLTIEGSPGGTLDDLAAAFDEAMDEAMGALLPPTSSPPAPSGLRSQRAASGPSASAAARPAAPAAQPAPVAQPAPRAAATPPTPAVGTGRIESVALLEDAFGSDDPDPVPASPRSAAEVMAQRASVRPGPSPFAAASARPLPTAALPSPALAAKRETTGALSGIRSARPSARPSVPLTSFTAQQPAPAPVASTGLPELDALELAPRESTLAQVPRRDRPTSEQRVITARLQMGMLKNHADDAQQEFKKGQVATPRKNAPSNLIMLSKRRDEFAEGVNSEDEIRQLYRDFVAALNRCGRAAEVVQFQAFAQRIQSQRSKVRAQYDGARVNMAVRVTEGRPKIVMRPAL